MHTSEIKRLPTSISLTSGSLHLVGSVQCPPGVGGFLPFEQMGISQPCLSGFSQYHHFSKIFSFLSLSSLHPPTLKGSSPPFIQPHPAYSQSLPAVPLLSQGSLAALVHSAGEGEVCKKKKKCCSALCRSLKRETWWIIQTIVFGKHTTEWNLQEKKTVNKAVNGSMWHPVCLCVYVCMCMCMCMYVLLVNALLCELQVKSVKTGSVFWTIGCCLSYFYMVRTETHTHTHVCFMLFLVRLVELLLIMCWSDTSNRTSDLTQHLGEQYVDQNTAQSIF